LFASFLLNSRISFYFSKFYLGNLIYLFFKLFCVVTKFTQNKVQHDACVILGVFCYLFIYLFNCGVHMRWWIEITHTYRVIKFLFLDFSYKVGVTARYRATAIANESGWGMKNWILALRIFFYRRLNLVRLDRIAMSVLGFL
jgi:hypothetical protein